MQRFGEYLRAKREDKGLSLEEIAASTRISVRQLQALETELFERLPGGVFNVSFTRQYARCVGLDEEEAVARLRQTTSTAITLPYAEATGQARDPMLAPGPLVRLAEMFTNFWRGHGSTFSSLAVGFALIIGGLYAYQKWDSLSGTASADAVAGVEEAASSRPAIVAIPAPHPESEVEIATSPNRPIELQLKITDTVWIRALADGRRIFEKVFQPGETRPIAAKNEVELKVGNAAGVTLALNGQDLPPIGPRGEVRNVTVTPGGLQVWQSWAKPAPEAASAPSNPTAPERWLEPRYSSLADAAPAGQ